MKPIATRVRCDDPGDSIPVCDCSSSSVSQRMCALQYWYQFTFSNEQQAHLFGSVGKQNKISWQLCIQEAKAVRNAQPVVQHVAKSRIRPLIWLHESSDSKPPCEQRIRKQHPVMYRAEQLQQLDLSKNNIQELNPIVFQNTLISSRRQTSQVSKLKHLNLAQNKIRSFNFESYFLMSCNSDISTATFQLEYLDGSSNCLYSVDARLAISSNHTKTRTDVTGKPLECECSGLGVWR